MLLNWKVDVLYTFSRTNVTESFFLQNLEPGRKYFTLHLSFSSSTDPNITVLQGTPNSSTSFCVTQQHAGIQQYYTITRRNFYGAIVDNPANNTVDWYGLSGLSTEDQSLFMDRRIQEEHYWGSLSRGYTSPDTTALT